MKRQAYKLLADLFDYPGPALSASVNQLIALLPEDLPQAVEALTAFQRTLQTSGLAALQELYIQVFDFSGDGALYIGHYLFGETGRRGVFLAELSERYREHHLLTNEEIPDHLSWILRYLAAIEPGEESSELIYACLNPAISRIISAKALATSPYRPLLESVPALLQHGYGGNFPSGDFAWTSSFSSPFPILR